MKSIIRGIILGLSLPLLMLGILADDPDASFSLDDFAFLANRFN